MPLNCGAGEDSWKSLGQQTSGKSCLISKQIKQVNLKGDQPWIFAGRNDTKADTPVLWSSDANRWLIGKDTDRLWEMVRDREAWHAAVHGVANSWTWLADRTKTATSFVIAILPRSKCLNPLAAVNVCRDLGAQENETWHCFHFFPIYLPWNGRTRCHDLHFLNAEAFPLSYFTFIKRLFSSFSHAATAAAKSLQSCLTLCDPIDGSPPGSPVPAILQARTLEWVAISFSNAWKWKVKVKSLSRVRLLLTLWTAAHRAPLFVGLPRQEHWSGLPFSSHTSH